MRTGLHDITDEEYFADKALNNSYLWKLISQTPAHAQIPSAKTEAMNLGSATHLAVLQPELANKQIIQGPETRRGKKWTDLLEQAKEENKILLTEQDYNTVSQMRDSVWRDPAIAKELNRPGTQYEMAAFWEENGVTCKIKVDAARPRPKNTIALIDLKTTNDASPKNFSQSVAKYGYHQQDAFYSHGWKQATGSEVESFLFLVVEKTPPFACAIYELDQIAKAEGWASAQKAMQIHKKCSENNNFYAYPAEKMLLSLPSWAFRHTNPRSINLTGE